MSVRRSSSIGVALAVSSLVANAAQPEENWDLASIRIVAAIRYLQVEGVSHAHLYLFHGDGKLIRQLTSHDSGNDVDPVFASDGKQVVFRRQKKASAEFLAIRVEVGGSVLLILYLNGTKRH